MAFSACASRKSLGRIEDQLARVEANTEDICGSQPGCSDSGRKKIEALGLKGIADGWNILPPGYAAEPGWFVSGGGLGSNQCTDLVSPTDKTPEWQSDPLSSENKRMDAVKNGRAVSASYSPFGVTGAFFRVARTEIEHSLDVSAHGVRVATSSGNQSMAAQLWRRVDEHVMSVAKGEDVFRACCAAYGCGDGIVVRATSTWDRMMFRLTDVKVDASGSYLLMVDVEGDFSFEKSDYSDDVHLAAKLDAGFDKATIPRKICSPPPSVDVVNQSDRSTWSIPVNCLPGFKLHDAGVVDIEGTGPTTKVNLKNPKASSLIQSVQLNIVPDPTGPFAGKGAPELPPLDVRFAVVSGEQSVSVPLLVKATRYQPRERSGVVARCREAKDTVQFSLAEPGKGLQLGVSSAWIADGSSLRPLEATFDADSRKVSLRCVDLAPAHREVCGGEEFKIVDLAIIAGVSTKTVGLPLATTPVRYQVQLDPGLYCVSPESL